MVGTEVSKGQVLCKACELSVRKDTLERHWNNKHKDRLLKGEKPEFKLPPMGSGSLCQFGVKKSQDCAQLRQLVKLFFTRYVHYSMHTIICIVLYVYYFIHSILCNIFYMNQLSVHT